MTVRSYPLHSTEDIDDFAKAVLETNCIKVTLLVHAGTNRELCSKALLPTATNIAKHAMCDITAQCNIDWSETTLQTSAAVKESNRFRSEALTVQLAQLRISELGQQTIEKLATILPVHLHLQAEKNSDLELYEAITTLPEPESTTVVDVVHDPFLAKRLASYAATMQLAERTNILIGYQNADAEPGEKLSYYLNTAYTHTLPIEEQYNMIEWRGIKGTLFGMAQSIKWDLPRLSGVKNFAKRRENKQRLAKEIGTNKNTETFTLSDFENDLPLQ